MPLLQSALLHLRRWHKPIIISVLSLAFLVGLGVLGVWVYGRSLNSNIDRIDAIPTAQPSATPKKTGAIDFLVVGSDSRDPENTDNSRTDTIMLAHVNEARDHVYLSSIARDTWVPIPGHGNGKINSAFNLGGAPLLVTTVQQYTGVTIDHFVMIDFSGFREVVNALGGVDMYVEKTITSIHSPYRTYDEGMRHFTGSEALDYVRQRKQFVDGDFSRMRHQQELIKAVMDQATSRGILTDPGKLNAFFQAMTSSLTVDRNFDVISTALELRDLRSSNMTFLTSPHKGTGMVGDQSVVFPDNDGARELYNSFITDTVPQYLARKPVTPKPSSPGSSRG